ncbi:MAG: TMEM14 family protein [Ignavibacteria bacterium]|nr:TMEM14 family protein [Ignavibacteria bacterium]MBP7093642.1 TMEM14 family protein [Candidatus Kapabacteria bacterium]MBK7032319.1 TMEM14 family protein [Ignavibacteria bacterium]MBK7185660.1 TMEM14 family protein [Ignavibacteria bacterium]MBK7412458.1 TMEM14 family protein [Ignavibacteria bacterium]
MHRRLGMLLIGYGLFLVSAGIVGFILTRETSVSSLFNGGIFGTLLIVLGVLHRQGRMWTHPASLSATAIFTLTFFWRTSLQWYEIANGDVTRVNIAVLLSIMSLVSLGVVLVLFRHYRH